MPIGTAAPTASQRAAAPHHLIEIVEPWERYSAARFAEDAIAEIKEIHRRGKRAIVVGGTGFYIRALAGDVVLSPPADPDIRRRLSTEARVHDAAFLHQWLQLREPKRATAIAREDRYRVLRALEVRLMRNVLREALPRTSLGGLGLPFIKIFVDVDDDILEQRIESRVDAMLRAGLVEEAERIGEQAVAASAVGYLQALAYLRGWETFAELRGNVVRATRRYAKRQRTWFRSEPQTIWLHSNEPLSSIEKMAREKLGWA